jgi:hypothetical protein
MLPAIQPVSITAQALVPERSLLVHHVAAMTSLSKEAIRWNARHGLLNGFHQADAPKIWRFWRRDVEAFIAWRNHVLQAN